MNGESKGRFKKTYIIPEVREPTLFDYVVRNVIPAVFKTIEYLLVAGLMLFLGMISNSLMITGVGYILLGAAYFYVTDKHIKFIKGLRFKTLWKMRLAMLTTMILYLVFTFGFFAFANSITQAHYLTMSTA